MRKNLGLEWSSIPTPQGKWDLGFVLFKFISGSKALLSYVNRYDNMNFKC